jgi:16S rRNA (cytidine1402-2'-O)-methyltransferase
MRCLKEMKDELGGNRSICVAREISKLYETYHRGTIDELIFYFSENDIKGELVILISPK